MQPPELVAVETGRNPQRVEASTPQRLVGIDVPHPRERALVEEGRLERGTTAGEALAEPRRREQGVERLLAYSGGEVGLRLPGLEQQPGAEPPHVPVRYDRSVV
jgi:hypothetical protein